MNTHWTDTRLIFLAIRLRLSSPGQISTETTIQLSVTIPLQIKVIQYRLVSCHFSCMQTMYVIPLPFSLSPWIILIPCRSVQPFAITKPHKYIKICCAYGSICVP